ncbi:MAG TPA: hypothetical protein PLV92_22435, partial [Pirellulaceae bacterium]|nr:hypothetical protein [Pirellulaceae bacterium]
HYLITEVALDMLNAELGNLAIAAAPTLGPEALKLRNGLLDPRSYFSKERRSTPVDIHLQSLDIPCPNGILTWNRDDLEQMSEATRAKLAETIRNLQAELLKIRNDNSVFRDFGDGVRTGWIPAKYLP